MRKRLNRAWAQFYSLIFLVMTLLALCHGGNEIGQAVLVWYRGTPVTASFVDGGADKAAWIEYRYEVDGKVYQNSQKCSVGVLCEAMEDGTLTVYCSENVPGASRLEKPSFLQLLWHIVTTLIFVVILVVLAVSGVFSLWLSVESLEPDSVPPFPDQRQDGPQ